jgi:type IV pilus assembly protein PilC
MLFSSRLPTADLIMLCRTLRHSLDAGLTLVQVFRQQAKRSTARLRPVADRIHDVLKQGNELSAALKEEGGKFPPLFVAMVGVGEATGTLPEVFAALEQYYQLQQRLWRQFVSQATLPALQFVAAIFVISGMILLLAILSKGDKPYDPLGLGLTGASGAATFFFGSFGIVAAFFLAYVIASRSLQQKAAVDAVLLRLPAVGTCLKSLAMARFCLAMHYTFETALPIEEALDLSLLATGNAAFRVKTPAMQDAVRGGDDLTTALTNSGLFSDEFLTVVATAEESGRLAEVMKQQAKFYEEDAELRLSVINRMAGFGVWAFVAILIIFAIFRLAMSYIGLIDQTMQSM